MKFSRGFWIVLIVALALVTFRSEHFSVESVDTLSKERRCRIRVIGVPVWSWRTSFRPGFPREFEALSGRKVSSAGRWTRGADTTSTLLGFSGWRCGSGGWAYHERRRLLEALYTSHSEGSIGTGEAREIFTAVERSLPTRDGRMKEGAVDLAGVMWLRQRLGLPYP